MKIGMLWFDNDKKKSPEQIISEAMSYYANKYQKIPNCVHVPQGVGASVTGVEIRQNRSVLPGHIWLGMSDES